MAPLSWPRLLPHTCYVQYGQVVELSTGWPAATREPPTQSHTQPESASSGKVDTRSVSQPGAFSWAISLAPASWDIATGPFLQG